MKHYCDEWIWEWCNNNGWTDLFLERCDYYWAFPPGAVMPEPIPASTLRAIKREKGFSHEERWWVTIAITSTVVAIALTCLMMSPMPLIFAFAFDAITVAQMENED